MLVTEKEAQEKWCPEARYVTENFHPATNSWKTGGKENRSPLACRCIASDCMMWRWADVPGVGDDQERLDEIRDRQSSGFAFGYCGKAGAP